MTGHSIEWNRSWEPIGCLANTEISGTWNTSESLLPLLHLGVGCHLTILSTLALYILIKYGSILKGFVGYFVVWGRRFIILYVCFIRPSNLNFWALDSHIFEKWAAFIGPEVEVIDVLEYVNWAEGPDAQTLQMLYVSRYVAISGLEHLGTKVTSFCLKVNYQSQPVDTAISQLHSTPTSCLSSKFLIFKQVF